LETASAGGKYGSIKAKQQNFHPTVKPLALMRYLIKLVTPPNGTVLDPFLGSGSTAVAATLEGFEWIGCEMTEDYWPIIEARVAWATEQAETPEPTLFD
jgi:site-specific DNA-methyltransferase (adenine-specific)